MLAAVIYRYLFLIFFLFLGVEGVLSGTFFFWSGRGNFVFAD